MTKQFDIEVLIAQRYKGYQEGRYEALTDAAAKLDALGHPFDKAAGLLCTWAEGLDFSSEQQSAIENLKGETP